MKGFLEEVAGDLYARYGEGLSERAVLFPSRRARLFFVDALTRVAGRPMWQPEWVTIGRPAIRPRASTKNSRARRDGKSTARSDSPSP